MEQSIDQKRQALLQKKKQLEADLPHLYGWAWYEWAWQFFKSENEINLLCAANQISKSSTQIRKCIDWATDTKMWTKRWRTTPNQMWYLYPSLDVASVEFEKKWIPEFMPKCKDHPVYGWTAVYERKHIKAIHFNTGVSVYFKTYAQDAKNLQTGSVDAIFCDEELPVDLYDELLMRISARGGYFHMVFTATLNQDFWRRALEEQGTDQEVLVEANKQQISMYDCLFYRDGSPSPWTLEKIKKIEDRCKSEAEKMRRVHGRFVREEGRKFHAFDPSTHYIKPKKIPESWQIYTGVDIGSGGATGHPSAITFLAIRPDFKLGYIFQGWRGDGVLTTAGDVLEKYQELRGAFKPVIQAYDWAAKDFGTIATRNGESFVKAEKSHELGEDIMNTLFKHGMLFIFDTEELRKLGSELLTLMKDMAKRKAKDDFCDSARYTITAAPWNFTDIGEKVEDHVVHKMYIPKTNKEIVEDEIKRRREGFYDPRDDKGENWEELDAEFEYQNELY